MGPTCGCERSAAEPEAVVNTLPEQKKFETPRGDIFNKDILEPKFLEMVMKLDIPKFEVKKKREALGPFFFQKLDIHENLSLHTVPDTSVPGEKYYGFMSDAKKTREYKGVILFNDGSTLESHFKNNLASGPGRRITSEGGVYEGMMENGDYYGRGKFTFPDGGYYEGEWIMGKQSGVGEEVDPGKGRYVGGYANGVRHGKGKFSLPDGSEYDGQWANGKQDGMGTLTWKSGKKYTGQWKDGMQDGAGTMWFPTGERYEGGFKEGKMNGKGKRIWDNGNTAQGNFVNGKLEGEAIITTGGLNPQRSEWKDGALKRIIGPISQERK